MNKLEFSNDLIEKANSIGVEISQKQAEQFYTYMELLLEWNEKMNLTAITDPEEVILKHFIDSLTIIPYLKEADTVLDIGTGAGFPGIPLKILEENKKFTLLDSLNKRIIFLQTVITELELKNIQAIHGRAEEFVSKERETYDIVTSRAVARLNVLLEYMLPFVKVGGRCICMKSFEIEEELKEAKKAIEILGGEIEKIDEITLPNTDIKRKIVVIKKVKNTPSKYPRKAGTPAKEPMAMLAAMSSASIMRMVPER